MKARLCPHKNADMPLDCESSDSWKRCRVVVSISSQLRQGGEGGNGSGDGGRSLVVAGFHAILCDEWTSEALRDLPGSIAKCCDRELMLVLNEVVLKSPIQYLGVCPTEDPDSDQCALRYRLAETVCAA